MVPRQARWLNRRREDMPDISLRDLLDAGVHFGHQTRRWNPKMKPYIFGEKNGIHIINLQKTAIQLSAACDFVVDAIARGQKILFVGTKRQASDIVAEAARSAEQFYVTHRWLGGMLTNFKTVKGSIDRLNLLEREQEEGKFEVLTKKERITKERQIAKLKHSLGGIQEMTQLPGIMFVIDPNKESIAVQEARRLNIPIVAVVDTNCDPDGISVVIPGNDDALKAIRLFTKAISDACIEGRQMAKDYARREYMNIGAQTVSSEEESASPEVLVKGGLEDEEAAAEGADADEASEAAAEAAPAEEAAEAPAEAAAEAEEAEAPAAEEAAAEEAEAPAAEEAAAEEAEAAPAEEAAAEEAEAAPAEEAAAEEAPAEEAAAEEAEEAPAEEAAAEEAEEAPAEEAAAEEAEEAPAEEAAAEEAEEAPAEEAAADESDESDDEAKDD